MRSKKALIVTAILGVVAALSIGATVAYFSGGAQSSVNVFTTGTMAVEINQEGPVAVSDVLPGSIYPISFTVTNTGTNPIFLKGYLQGEWSDSELSSQMLSVIGISVANGSTPYSLTQFGEALGTEFLVTADDQIGMLELMPGQSEEITLTVAFSEAMDNQYQGKEMSLALHLAAKQSQPGADWPAEY